MVHVSVRPDSGPCADYLIQPATPICRPAGSYQRNWPGDPLQFCFSLPITPSRPSVASSATLASPLLSPSTAASIIDRRDISRFADDLRGDAEAFSTCCHPSAPPHISTRPAVLQNNAPPCLPPPLSLSLTSVALSLRTSPTHYIRAFCFLLAAVINC